MSYTSLRVFHMCNISNIEICVWKSRIYRNIRSQSIRDDERFLQQTRLSFTRHDASAEQYVFINTLHRID